MKKFDGAIWHQQSIHMFIVLLLLGGALDGLLRKGPVLRMHSFEDKFDGRFGRGVVLKDAVGFL